MTFYYTSFPIPLGQFSVAVDSAGAVVATAFGGLEALRGRLGACDLVEDRQRPTAAQAQVREFFSGQRDQFELPLAPSGTESQQRVWAELQRIPYGQTRTYRQIAAAIGRPSACRAVGRANATNPICLIIPCHRVIGSDGSLTGFAFGEPVKRDLLAFEAQRSRATAAA